MIVKHYADGEFYCIIGRTDRTDGHHEVTRVQHCGYVCIPAGHWASGQDYQKLAIDCHWGLTYSAPRGGIRGSEEVTPAGFDWMIGYDCGHDRDDTPDIQCEQYQIKELKNIVAQLRGDSLVQGENIGFLAGMFRGASLR